MLESGVDHGRALHVSGKRSHEQPGRGAHWCLLLLRQRPHLEAADIPGLTAADCDPEIEPCVPKVGPIHTVPNYYERGLRTIGDPSIAFGPSPDQNGHFSWSNGSRLYVATIVTNFTNTSIREEARMTPSRLPSFIDNVTPERI